MELLSFIQDFKKKEEEAIKSIIDECKYLFENEYKYSFEAEYIALLNSTIHSSLEVPIEYFNI